MVLTNTEICRNYRHKHREKFREMDHNKKREAYAFKSQVKLLYSIDISYFL